MRQNASLATKRITNKRFSVCFTAELANELDAGSVTATEPSPPRLLWLETSANGAAFGRACVSVRSFSV